MSTVILLLTLVLFASGCARFGKMFKDEDANEGIPVEELFPRNQAELGPDRVQQRRRMAFRQDESIVQRMPGVLRIVAHLREEERGDQIGGRQARRRMPASGLRRGSNRLDPEAGCDVFQCRHGRRLYGHEHPPDRNS